MDLSQFATPGTARAAGLPGPILEVTIGARSWARVWKTTKALSHKGLEILGAGVCPVDREGRGDCYDTSGREYMLYLCLRT